MGAWRVVSWNLLGSQGLLVESVAAALIERCPDAIAVQEVQRRQARSLAKRLGWHHVWALKHFPYSPLMWWRAEGLAILSPHELTDTMRMRISDGRWTWNYRRRVLMGATIRRGADQLYLYDTHLGGSQAERVPQMRRIANRLALDHPTASLASSSRSSSSSPDPPMPFVLAGDLNAVDDPVALWPLLALGLTDPGGDNSNPAENPYQRIDYVLIPESASVTERETPSGGAPWDRLSDHLPVLVAFSVSIETPDP